MRIIGKLLAAIFIAFGLVLRILSNADEYKLIINAKDVYVGQKVDFILRLKTKKPIIRLDVADDPERDGLEVKSLTKRQVNDNEIELIGYFYPKKSSDFCIGPLSIKYRVPIEKDNQNNQQGFWAIFMQPSVEQKEAFTKAVSLKVLPLPKYNKEVNAIGDFINFNIKIAQSSIKQSEAVVLTLCIEGKGNFDNIDHPKLILPDGLKYYNSKNSFDGKEKKFEYIIQPLEHGKFVINPQEFVFFDIYNKKFITLRSQTIKLEILANQITSDKNITPDLTRTEVSNDIAKTQFLVNINESKAYNIPNYLFLFLILLPILGKLCLLFCSIFYSNWSKRRIITNTRALVKKAALNDDATSLYLLVKQNLCNYFGIDKNSTDKFCDLIAQNLDKLNSQQWMELHELLLTTQYCKEKKDNRELFEKTERFLSSLNKAKFFLIFFLGFILQACATEIQDPQIFNSILKLRRIEKKAIGKDIIAIDNNVKSLKLEQNYSELGRPYNKLHKLYINLFVNSVLFWQILFIILWWILILFVSIMSMRYKVVLIILLIVSCFECLLMAYFQNTLWGLIKVKEASLNVGPHESYPQKKLLNYLDDVKIIKKDKNWYYVDTCTGRGWIDQQNVEIV